MTGDITRSASDNSDSKFQVYDNNSILGLSTYEHDKCFMEQVYCITIFYIINVIIAILLWWLGSIYISTEDLICARHSFIIVNSNLGVYYMAFHSGTIFAYSYFMYYIFYRLPRNFHLVSYQKLGTRKIETNQSKIIVSQSMV